MEEIKQFFSSEDLFARHSGIELLEVGPGWAKAGMKIEPYHFNGAKTVHGGAIFTLADFAADLRPDVVGGVLALPFPDKSYDIACAFEVLEHLPFEQFDKALTELVRVARTHVAISIPHFGPMFSFSLKVPLLPQIRFAFKIPFHKRHAFNGQHYWELGKRGYTASLIRQKLSVHGDIVRFVKKQHR